VNMRVFYSLLVIAVGSACAVPFCLTELRKPSDTIRASLLQKTPLGSSLEAVCAIADSQGWQRKRFQKGDNGFFDLYRLRSGGIGESGLYAHLGDYQGFPWWVSVWAMWIFDANDNLIEIKVDKIMDSP
jgi:hypothetical protein